MYVKTESGEIIEFHDPLHPEIRKISRDNYTELYEKLYARVGVKPVEGTPSWQLLSARLDENGEEICLAMFDTFTEASDALGSLEEIYDEGVKLMAVQTHTTIDITPIVKAINTLREQHSRESAETIDLLKRVVEEMRGIRKELEVIKRVVGGI